MDVATHTVSDAGKQRSGPSSAVALGDEALGLAVVAQADAASSLMSEDLEAAGARLAVDTVRLHVAKHADLREDFDGGDEARERITQALETALGIAGKEVDALARRRRTHLEVTADVVWQVGAECFVAHVGDGRVYLLRKGLVHKLTQDHLKEALSETDRHLTRTVGARDVNPETLSVQLARGDRVVVASPWLHRGLDDLGIREIATDPVPDGVTSRLLGASRARRTLEDMACALVVVEGGDQEGHRNSRLETLARIPSSPTARSGSC